MIDYFGGVISPNGKWFGAFYNDYDENDNTINYPVIINIETDKRIVLGPYPASMFGLADAMAITDQGTLYIDDSVNGGVVGFTPDGDYFLSQAAPVSPVPPSSKAAHWTGASWWAGVPVRPKGTRTVR